jgi:hypothetical protein
MRAALFFAYACFLIIPGNATGLRAARLPSQGGCRPLRPPIVLISLQYRKAVDEQLRRARALSPASLADSNSPANRVPGGPAIDSLLRPTSCSPVSGTELLRLLCRRQP